MKKRLVALLVLALVMVLALTSCEFIQNIKDKINPPAEEYAVYFIVGEGASRVPAQTVKEGELVTKPTDPTFVGFVFGGWFKEEAFTTPWNFETDKVERNTMIYAKWVECTQHSGGAATCTKGAVCELCGKTYTEALGHKGGAATCTEGAVCELCGKTYTEALGHKGGTATCEGKAVCEVCGKEYGDPLGHTPGEAVKENDVAPDCDTAGSYDVVVYCSVCGEELSRETVTVDALGHTEETIPAVDPDCTNNGLTEGKKCSVCGEVLVAQEPVDALGHTPGAPVKENEVKGDCLTESSHDTVFYCSVCGEELQRDTTTVPAPGHKDENADDYCDACGESLVDMTTIALELTDADISPSQGPQTVRVGEFEIILSSAKSRIESSSKTFKLPDGSQVKKSYRINFNGSESIYDPATGEWQNAIMFNAGGKGTVTIWWYHAGKPNSTKESDLAKARRNVAIWDAEGKIIAQTDEQYQYEDLIITTFEFDAAGTYYIGNLVGANNFYYVEVSYEGELVELPDLAKYNVHFNTGEGSAVNSLQVEENATVEKPEDPTREGFDFAGWYKDEECTTPWNFSADRITSDTVLYAKWEATYTGEYEDVHYEVNISNLETGKRTEDEINGMFTIVADTEVRNRTKTWTDPENAENTIEFTKSVKIGGNANMIKVSVPGDGKLTFFIQNGSSGVDTQFTKVIAPDGTIYDIEFIAGSQSNPVVKIELDVTEGEWTITRGKNGGTQDIFFLSLDCTVEVSPETGFELVDDGKIDYVLGEELDLSKVVLNATFENGKTEPLTLADVTVDYSSFNKDAEGTYTITISYKEYTPITYQVNVYAPVSVELDFDAIEKLANNSAAGNGVYYNHSFRELYFLDEELDLSGLSVTVVAKCGEATKSFRVTDYEITGFDASEGGEKELTVSYGGVSTTVKVYVSYTEPTADEFGVYNALVDPAYLGIIGDLSGPYHVFNTIQQALDFLAKANPTAQKVITIAPGQYNEKLEITIPNLKIVGVGESSKDVVIEWDSLYGLLDAGGFSHTTDSTATVAIRDAATNVSIENVTISNYWNSQERMDAAGLGIERGLALLVQSDRFTMKNARLLGIQDTLELFTGRQYFENVYISGYTDFIFGTNNTTYFKNCQIHVIDTVKDDGGTAGYITAFKGSNKGASDSIVYGTIFDGCKFTADEGVMAGKTAIGRPWGAYAAVAVINSELGGHISLAGYSTSKNERYVSMNAKPTDETVQFVEYNNTGAGALTEAVAGMRMLTAEEAAKYVDFATIFGTTNGNITYLDPWDPNSTEIVVDDREYYYFNGQEGTSGTSYTYTDNIQGTTGSIGNITIDATAGKVTARGSDTQINAGAKLTFDVKAGTLVTVISYPGYGHYTLNGVANYANDTFSQYYAEDTTVTLEATATAYIYQIIINPGEEAPEAPELVDVKVSGLNLNYTVGDELSLEGAVVKAYYSDYSVVTVSDYTVDASAVNNAAAGSYDIVFTYGGKTVTVTVTYEGSNADPAITEDITLDFSTPAGLEAVQNNPRVTIDGSVRHNGGEIQIQGTISFMVKAGTTIVVNPYANTQYASYTIGALGEENLTTYNVSTTYVAVEDCTVVYTGLSNNYLVSIVITMGADEEPEEVTYVLDAGNIEAFAAGAKADGDTEVINDYFKIHYSVKTKVEVKEKSYDDGYTATQRISWGGSSKVGSSIKNAIEFTVEAGATIKVWWASGDNSRTLDLVDANGTVISSVGSDAVKNSLYINEFTVSEAGTYYLACLAGSNYIAKVEVTTTK